MKSARLQMEPAPAGSCRKSDSLRHVPPSVFRRKAAFDTTGNEIESPLEYPPLIADKRRYLSTPSLRF
jgi:hypothetical protein